MSNAIYEEINKEEYPKDAKARVDKVIEIVRPWIAGSAITDIGCGNCYVGNKLGANSFYDYFALKDSDVKFIDLVEGKIEGNPKFDTILLFHVLEHFHDPDCVLYFLWSLLNKNGRLILSVPVGDYDNKHQPFNEKLGHYYKFTQDDMFSLFMIEDYEIEFFRKVTGTFDSKGYDEYVFVLKKLDK